MTISDEELSLVFQKTLKTVGMQVHVLSDQLKDFTSVFKFELNRTGHAVTPVTSDALQGEEHV